MRLTFMIAAAACGQMYQQPGAQPAPADPEPPTQVAANPQPAAPAANVVMAEATPAATPGSVGGSMADQFVAAHNRVRAKHCAQPLAWSPKLATIAQRWADALRDRHCSFGHSNGTTGENLAAGTIGALDPTSTVDFWYSEIKDYNFSNGGFSEATGHFTQVVWKATRSLGCGHSQCNGNDIWVCEYDPAGNWEGQYRENVLPRGCK